MLPVPFSDRWKPLRAGLVDMFYYDAEEFWFHDGRLLLRGNNGTGKSKVLALTLPFLLDGELAPHRVEPDGDRQKKMEWNLLLGGRHPNPERLGYTWLEFGRRAPGGDAEFRTIGCGLKAVAGRGIARHWFFMTTQRVGDDLHLLPASRVPLTREKLREEIDGRGLVYDRATDYRRAIDEALFGLGEHRYESLINLLIQLRQPQLSKRPDEKLLSRALTEALPPLSPGLLTTVAEAFRGLDEERDALRALREARQAADDFLRYYSRYAMTAAKRKAAGPRQAQSRYEQLGRDLAAADEAFSAADAQLRMARAELEGLEQRRIQLDARREALQQDPAMRDAERLEQMLGEAQRRDRTARIREQDRDRLAAEVRRRCDRADEAAARAQAAQETLEAAHARAEESRLAAELQLAAERLASAEQEAGRRARDLASTYRSYLAGLTELKVADPDDLIDALEAWAVTGDGANPASAAVDDAARAAGAKLGRLEAGLSARRATHAEHAVGLEAEIERLRAGGHDAPPAPHTRAPGVRDDLPGAPFWKVIDFAQGVPDEHRAGLEAALEAAGILDAWVTPDGNLVNGDVTVVSGLAPMPGPSVASVLVPAIDSGDPSARALPTEAVDAVLAAIGLGGPGGTWVAANGRWANGVLSGAWQKDSAGHIGEGSRESARRAKITRLSDELAQERTAITELDTELAELAVRRDRLADEHRAVPPDAGVREAHTVAAGERRRRRELREQHAEAVNVSGQRQREHEAALARTAEFSRDVGLPAEPGDLAEVKAGVDAYRLALAGLWPAAEVWQGAVRTAGELAAELAESRERLDEATDAAATAQAEASAAREMHEALRETAGTAVDELYRQLAEVRQEMGRRADAEKAARGVEQQALGDRGKAEGARDTLREQIDEAGRLRDAAVAEFQSFAATGLLGVALPSIDVPDLAQPWAATPAVLLARAVNAGLELTDDADGAWDRIQKRVTEEHKLLADAMARHGHSAGLTLSEGVIVVDVVFQGRSHDIPGLAAALGEETEQRARLLSAREQEILENHLLNEVAGTLHELITAAEAEVRQMNGELQP